MDASGFNSTLSKMESAATRGLAVIGSAVAGAVTAVAGIGVNYNAQVEQLQTSFEVMTGSAEEAAGVVENLKKVAAETPFEMTDLAETTQLLMNYGFSAEEAQDRLMMLGDISQGSAEKMTRIATAYGQMSSAGKVSLEDVKQMIEAGFNPLQEISQSTGESMASLYDRISKGTLSIDEITASMQRSTSEGGKYFQSMEKQSQTFSGQLSTLKDNALSTLGALTSGLTKGMTEGLLPELSAGLEQISSAFSEGGISGLIDAAESAIPQMIAAISQQLPSMVTLGTGVLTALVNGLVASIPALIDGAVQMVDALVVALGESIPSIVSAVIAAVPQIIQALLDSIPVLLDAAIQFLLAIVQAIPTLIQELVAQLPTIIQSITNFLVNNVPALLDAAIQLLYALIDALPTIIDALVTALPEIIDAITTFLTENIGMILDAAIQMLHAVIDAIPQIIPPLVDALPEIITEITDALIDAWPLLLQAGMDLLGQLIAAIPKILPDLIAKLPEIASTILGELGKLPGRVFAIGEDLIRGIWDGIKSMGNWIKDKISEFADGIVGGFKDFFGIASPSKVMRKEIGRWLPPGIVDGAEDAMPKAERSLRGMIDDMISRARITVDSAQSASAYIPRAYEDDDETQSASADGELTIEVPLNLDGREVARATAKYTGRRLAWEG